jgi:DNA polymerase alpha subunit B
MADVDALAEELNKRFTLPSTDVRDLVIAELQSILRLHGITPEDLSFKWESYCMKMGPETQMELGTVREFKTHLQEDLERESTRKAHKHIEKRALGATPRAGAVGADVFSM